MDGDKPSRSWWVFLIVSSLVVVALLGVAGMRMWNRAPAVGQEREEPAVALELVPTIPLNKLPVGVGYPLELQAAFKDPMPRMIVALNPKALPKSSPVPIVLFRDDDGHVSVFYHRDPRSLCKIAWADEEQLFIDPCHGSAYDSKGRRVRGPSPRGLDQFGAVVDDQGMVYVDVADFRVGPAAN